MIPIGFLDEGDVAEIFQIKGGRGVVLRMNELGFYPGSRVRILKNVKAGPVLIELKGGKIAIGRGVAMKIFCKKIDNT